jgi:hypothetical protein
MANSREERKQRSLGFNYNLYSKGKKAKKMDFHTHFDGDY